MGKFISKALKLSFALAIFSATLFSCSEDVVNPDESAIRPPASKLKTPQR